MDNAVFVVKKNSNGTFKVASFCVKKDNGETLYASQYRALDRYDITDLFQRMQDLTKIFLLNYRMSVSFVTDEIAEVVD